MPPSELSMECFSLSELRRHIDCPRSPVELGEHGCIRKPLFLKVIAHRSEMVEKLKKLLAI